MTLSNSRYPIQAACMLGFAVDQQAHRRQHRRVDSKDDVLQYVDSLGHFEQQFMDESAQTERLPAT